MKIKILIAYLIFFTFLSSLASTVIVGQEILLEGEALKKLTGRKIGLITNHTAVDSHMNSTLKKLSDKVEITAIFAPEHGLNGSSWAGEWISDGFFLNGVPVYSLHGKTRRPTAEMLKGLDLLIYDIQDIGSRSYTFSTTLFYVMEEAAKHRIEVMVLDRPNPINGLMVDGPMLEDKWRSFVGYVNVPYCHGMTIGELALFFNKEYRIGCRLTVVPMKGWKREMSFQQTGLPWVPTSPNVPEAASTNFYPATGILGELELVSIGIGYTLPFKIVGAPWIDAEVFAKKLNEQKLAGVLFYPFHFTPFYGTLGKKECHGVLIHVTDPIAFLPVTSQYVLIGLLKSLYPKEFHRQMLLSDGRKEMFHKVNGTDKVWQVLKDEQYVVWKLKGLHERERKEFLKKRAKYLLY